MITIEKFGLIYNFIEDSSTLEEIFTDNYKVIEKKVPFGTDDIIIDIGANIGAFSILYAKLMPFIKVYAIEPVAETYVKLCKNIKLNNLTNIIPINSAISGGKKIEHIIYSPIGTGGASAYVTTNIEPLNKIYISCLTLDELFKHFNITECKLLKIDCEGAEYDILYNSKLLNRVNYLVGEFHENSALRQAGHSMNNLAHYCATQVKNMLYYEMCEMHE